MSVLKELSSLVERVDLRRVRKILRMAADQVKTPFLKSWFTADEEGKWERRVVDMLNSTADKAEKAGMSPDEVDAEVATAVAYLGAEGLRKNKGRGGRMENKDLSESWDEPEFPGLYFMSTTYETWDEESLEIGETDDRGYEYEDVKYDSLDELIADAEHNHSWIEWSSSRPGPHDWVISDEDNDYRTGESTVYNLHISKGRKRRGDPLTKEEIRFISVELGI